MVYFYKIIIVINLIFLNVMPILAQPNNKDLHRVINNANNSVRGNERNLEEETYKYKIWVIQYTKKIYEYQHTSSKLLLGVSVIVLTCGLYFSYMQFKDRTKIHKNITLKNDQNLETQENLTEKDNDSQTSLKIGMAGIEISSSIIGLLILCVSLAFFYLYIANIYPIESSDSGHKEKLPSLKLDEPSTSNK